MKTAMLATFTSDVLKKKPLSPQHLKLTKKGTKKIDLNCFPLLFWVTGTLPSISIRMLYQEITLWLANVHKLPEGGICEESPQDSEPLFWPYSQNALLSLKLRLESSFLNSWIVMECSELMLIESTSKWGRVPQSMTDWLCNETWIKVDWQLMNKNSS